jgi:hypothetical protein
MAWGLNNQSLDNIFEQLIKEEECGNECQRNKKISELKSKYDSMLSRENNKDKLPDELKDARKQYFTYAFGKKYYDDQERKILTENVDKHIKKMKDNHNKMVKQIRTEQKERRENEIAIHRMKQLHDKYVVSNDKMLDSLDNQEATVETSHRKVYYTLQKITRIDFYRKIVTYILRILLAVSIMYFIYKKKYVSLSIIIVLYLLIRHFS